MAAYLTGVLGLLDGTLRAMMGVPILSFFLAFLLMAAVLGLFLMLKDLAVGRRSRGRRNE